MVRIRTDRNGKDTFGVILKDGCETGWREDGGLCGTTKEHPGSSCERGRRTLDNHCLTEKVWLVEGWTTGMVSSHCYFDVKFYDHNRSFLKVSANSFSHCSNTKSL